MDTLYELMMLSNYKCTFASILEYVLTASLLGGACHMLITFVNSFEQTIHMEYQAILLYPYKPSILFMGLGQTVQTQIRCSV